MPRPRDGIPLRVWCWPGSTSDSALIRQVKDDLRGWSLSKVVWVAGRGFTSSENRHYLRKGGNQLIDGASALPKDKRAELRGVISTKPGLNCYLRITPGGLLRIDAARAKAEENLDGKYLLRTSDPKMTAEDIALGYRQLLEVERGWRET